MKKKIKIQHLQPTKDPTATTSEVYFFSSAFKRIFVRFLDLVALITSALIFIILILITRSGHNFADNWNYLTTNPLQTIEFHPWRIFVMWCFIFLIYTLYFVVLVKLTNGYTFFGYLFKIRIINDTESLQKIKLKYYQLFRKEAIVLYLSIIINLFFSFVILVWKPNSNGLLIMIEIYSNSITQSLNQQIFSAIFSVIFGLTFLVQFIYLIGMFFNSKKIAWQDSAGQLVVIDYHIPKSHQYQKIDWKKFRAKTLYQNQKKLPGIGLDI